MENSKELQGLQRNEPTLKRGAYLRAQGYGNGTRGKLQQCLPNRAAINFRYPQLIGAD